MTGARDWNFLKNLAILALLSALSFAGPAYSFDAKYPSPPPNRPGRALSSGKTLPRPPGPRPQPPYRFVPPRIARKYGLQPYDPEDPKQRFPEPPRDSPRARSDKNTVRAAYTTSKTNPSYGPPPYPPSDDSDLDYPEDHRWLEQVPGHKLPKPPKYSQARHPRLQKAHVPGEQPLARSAKSRHPAQPLASIQGHHESSPSDLKEGVSVSPETHPMREEKGLLRIPSAKRLEKHFENSKPRHHRHEEKGGRRRPQCGSHQRPSTPAFHGSSAQRPKKPPRYSDARHPRVKKASAYK
ncbi:hypothetical protein MTO96_032232 [Rhipicephalus appendiculatus]